MTTNLVVNIMLCALAAGLLSAVIWLPLRLNAGAGQAIEIANTTSQPQAGLVSHLGQPVRRRRSVTADDAESRRVAGNRYQTGSAGGVG